MYFYPFYLPLKSLFFSVFFFGGFLECLSLGFKFWAIFVCNLLPFISKKWLDNWFTCKFAASFPGRVCPFTGKKANKANKISHSAHKTKKLQFVNLQYKKIWWEAGKRYVKLRLSTKALKTIEKNGLDAVAKKAGIDLRKEWLPFDCFTLLILLARLA